MITVQDSRIGFQQKYAEWTFGLFRRVHRDEFPGTGLGSAICQRTMESFGERVWAKSELGVGSGFSFALTAAGV